MQTKIFSKFYNRLNSFDDDIELMEVLYINIVDGNLTNSKSNNVIKNLDRNKFKHLARLSNKPGSRDSIARHLKSTVYAAYVKDVYEEVTQYMRVLLELVSSTGYDPEKLMGKFYFTIDSRDLLRLGSWQAVCEHAAIEIIRDLERERSTLGLLQNMSDRLGLGISKKEIEAALPYLEARHYLVHADGKPNQKYREKYPNIEYSNDRISIGYEFVTEMRRTVRALVGAYDKAVIERDLLPTEHVNGKSTDCA